MTVDIYVEKTLLFTIPSEFRVVTLKTLIENKLNLNPSDYYLHQNGKRLINEIPSDSNIHIGLRLVGGKGGFGSMLRAIGAQIEKTTNREACRDLSGRRLRDINEEKRLKTWLDSKRAADEQAEDKVEKKIKKLMSKPKHEFNDKEYDRARSDLTETVADSLEEGLKRAEQNLVGGKRKANDDGKRNVKKPKKQLWLGDDLSSGTDTDTEDSDNNDKPTKTSDKSTETSTNTSDTDPETTEIANKI